MHPREPVSWLFQSRGVLHVAGWIRRSPLLSKPPILHASFTEETMTLCMTLRVQRAAAERSRNTTWQASPPVRQQDARYWKPHLLNKPVIQIRVCHIRRLYAILFMVCCVLRVRANAVRTPGPDLWLFLSIFKSNAHLTVILSRLRLAPAPCPLLI